MAHGGPLSLLGFRLLVLLALGVAERTAPQYTAATIVHAVTGVSVLAPNTFASIYGRDLAFTTRQLSASDLAAGLLPINLPGTGVQVFVDGVNAPVFYVSPTQINFLVPSHASPGREAQIWMTLDGRTGPRVPVRMVEAAPALFPIDPETILAVKLDGTTVSGGNPALGGHEILLFAAGLGPTLPETPYRQLARDAAPILRRSEFRLLLNAQAVDDEFVRYVGAAPGFAGLYQINLRLPDSLPQNPEVRIMVAEASSQTGLRLPSR